MATPVLMFLCTALFLASHASGSDLAFTSSPSTIRQLITEELTLRCGLTDSAASVVVGKRHLLSDVISPTSTSEVISPTSPSDVISPTSTSEVISAPDTSTSDVISDTSPSDVSFVHSIIISKSGVDVASIAEHFPARVFDNTTGVTVTGQIPGLGAEKGFLQISWKYPGAGQSGTYKCDVRGMDASGHDQDFSQTLHVTDNEVTINDMVMYIHQLKLNNDRQVAALNARLNTTNANVKVEINNLKTSNADLTAEVNNLKNKLSQHVMFTAIRTSSVQVPHPNVIVFDRLKTSIGGGYDTSTGVFTAPIAGYYTFDLHLLGQQDKYAIACITHNNNTCITTAYADDGFDLQSASTSVHLQLQQGDTVKVVSFSSPSYVEGWSNGYCSFSGQLISAA